MWSWEHHQPHCKGDHLPNRAFLTLFGGWLVGLGGQTVT
jgi:hypothetical protein